MSDATDKPGVSAEVMTFASFLETKPPGVNIMISDLFSPETSNHNRYTPWQITTPRLTLHCDDPFPCGLGLGLIGHGVAAVQSVRMARTRARPYSTGWVA
jgi:hypothetical protein